MSRLARHNNYFSPTVIKRLSSITKSLNKRNIHDWRQSNLVEKALRSDTVLIFELDRMSNRNPQLMIALADICTISVRQRLVQLQQLRNEQNLDSSHPNVINNINHPQNPANPNALQNLLQLNATLNPLFTQSVNIDAAVVATENEEATENQEQQNNAQYNERVEHILTDPNVSAAAQQGLKDNPHLDPHKTLGVARDAPHEQIQAAVLYHSAKHAPEKGAEPSHAFRKIAAATVLIATPALRKAFDDKTLADTAQHTLKGTPTPSPITAR